MLIYVGPYKVVGDRLDLVSILVNFSCELGQTMTKYNFLYNGLDEWFWAMFEPTWTDLIWLLVNFSCELGPIMTRYDFLLVDELFWAMLEPIWTWPDMTSYGLDEWFWAMFKPTWPWPNLTFGLLFMWIGPIMTRYDFLWLDEWFWARFRTDLTLT